MAKTFEEVFNEIKGNVTLSKKGKIVKSFSRTDFDKLAKAFLNTPGYTVTAIGTKEGEVVEKEIKPVEKFRGMIQAILKDFGVDKQEAARVLEDSYEIKNIDGMYEVCSELIYKYLDAGKKFDFITQNDFLGSLTVDEVAETVGTFRNIRTKEEIKIKKKAHKVLKHKSKCPKWLKERQ